MLDGFTKAVIGMAVVILSLGGWIYYQSNKIDELTAQNQQQSELILNQQEANQALITKLEQEKQAVENQQKIANDLKAQVSVERENVKKVLIKEPCSGTAMPVGVVDSIKRLHK